jgi:hypothetical protein
MFAALGVRVAALDHERLGLTHHAVELGAVVEALLRQLDERSNVIGSILTKELELDDSPVSGDHGNLVALDLVAWCVHGILLKWDRRLLGRLFGRFIGLVGGSVRDFDRSVSCSRTALQSEHGCKQNNGENDK